MRSVIIRYSTRHNGGAFKADTLSQTPNSSRDKTGKFNVCNPLPLDVEGSPLLLCYQVEANQL